MNIKGLISVLLVSLSISVCSVAFAKLPVGMNTNEIQHVDSSAPFVNVFKMAMPFKTNCQKLGPIEVSEDNRHFLVRIHPEDRGRAKKIAGRQWDGERRVWVYSKNIRSFPGCPNQQ